MQVGIRALNQEARDGFFSGRPLLAALALVGALWLGGCGGGGGDSGTEPPPTGPGSLALTVSKTGSGVVRSVPAGIDCGNACQASYPVAASVTLTATPDAGQSFSGWGGACAGSLSQCTVVMTQARAVSAAFVPSTAARYSLTVALSGSGRVSSQPAGIDCGSACSASYASGTNVTLTAAADTGHTFSGWGGACSGTVSTCTLPITQSRSVVASFATQTAAVAWGAALAVESSGDFNVHPQYHLNAISSNGNAMVIWQQSDGLPDGGVSKVWSRYYVAGQGWGPVMQVPGLQDFNSRWLVGGKLFLDPQGMATWIRPDLDVRRYTAANGWSGPILPPTRPSGAGQFSAGVMHANGDISVVTTLSDVYQITLSANGPWQTWTRIDSSGALDTDVADIARSSDGSAMVIWSERNPGDSNYSMKAARYVPGSGFGAPVTIDNSLDSVASDSPPRVAMDASGNAMAVWRQGSSIWVNQFSPTTGWSTATAFDTGALSSNRVKPRLVMTADGRAIVSWQSGLYAIKTMAYNPGSGFSTPVQATPYGLDRELGIDAQGNATLVYVSVDQWPNPTSTEISVYSRRLVWGQGWSTPVLVETQPGGIQTGLAVSFMGSRAVAAWAQYDQPTSTVRNSLWANLMR